MATFRKRNNGWQARIQRKGYRPIAKTFASRQDAEKWARKTESDLDLGKHLCTVRVPQVTLTAALDRYEAEVSAFKRSYPVERYYIAHWRKSRLSGLSLTAVRAVDVAAYRDQRLKEGLSPTSVRHELGLLSHLYTVAIRDWGYEHLTNPVKLVRQPKPNRSRERRVSDTEVHAICEFADHEMRVCIWTALLTAMRRGEILGLCWADVDLEKRVITLDLTKNGDRRLVPLSQDVVRRISELPRRADGHVFGMKPGQVSRIFKALVERARAAYTRNGGEDPRYLTDLHFHDLRHEAASRLMEQGLHPFEIMAITGHRDTKMLKRYTHPRVEQLLEKII